MTAIIRVRVKKTYADVADLVKEMKPTKSIQANPLKPALSQGLMMGSLPRMPQHADRAFIKPILTAWFIRGIGYGSLTSGFRWANLRSLGLECPVFFFGLEQDVGVVTMAKFSKLMTRFTRDETGATAIEYGLIAALIAVVIIGALTLLGTTLETKFNEVSNSLNN